jgi:UDP-glucose:glycoprotein glucosyltransferase
MIENLYDDKEDEQAGGIWNSITNTFGGGGSNKDSDDKKEENVLNIFSVASGHLYERFLR